MAEPPVVIAPLEETDLVSCVEIMSRSLPWTRYGMSDQMITSLWQSALCSGAAVSVARIEDKTAGFSWYIERGGFGLSGYLKLLGVHPDVRGRGVGSVLLEYTERLAGAAGARDLLLLVSDFNHAARKFYKGHGYARIGSIPDYVVPGIAEVILRKRLTEATR